MARALRSAQLALIAATVFTGIASAHDSGTPFAAWMKSLHQPDFPLSSCCGPADQYFVREYGPSDKDGMAFAAVVIDGQGKPDFPVEIPRGKVIWDRVNPTGRGVIFILSSELVGTSSASCLRLGCRTALTQSFGCAMFPGSIPGRRGQQMRRRDVLALLGGGVVSLPLGATAQQPRRVGFLRLTPVDGLPAIAEFRAGLEETGYLEGRNLVIEYRYADGDYARLPELAADLVRRNVDVIMTSGTQDAVRAAMRATSTIPIVGTSVGGTTDPPVKHFNRPEGNVTGVSITTGELTPKRLQILAEMVPGAAIGVLMNPTLAAHKRSREQIENAAGELQVKLVFATASTEVDLDPAVADLAQQHVGAILPEAEPFLGNSWRRLVGLGERHKIPMMQEWRDAVVAGGLMCYAPSLSWVARQTGRYAGQILNGAKPADLPVQQPTKIELIINLKTAKALGLTVPQSLLARADEVIE